MVWAVNMQTGEPMPQGNVKLYSLDGETPVVGETDENGFFEADLDLKDLQTRNNEWTPEFWATFSKGADFSFVGI